MEKVDVLKNRGNKALAAGKYDDAIKNYTEACIIDPNNYILYSNRSAAFAKCGRFREALRDAEKTIALNPNWPKGYSRKGVAAVGLGDFEKALDAYSEGLKYDPGSQILHQGRRETAAILLKGINSYPPSSPKSFTTIPKRTEPQKPAEPNVECMSEENRVQYAAKQEKEAGNDAYKKKDFNTALQHYNAALKLNPTDITFYNNIAAVHFERKEYEDCIKVCEKAVEVGRENRADFKMIAKALARIGNSYKKLEDYRAAKVFFEKALSEHRTPELKTSLSEVEAKIKEVERSLYINPELAEEEKEKGNELFRMGDFSNAIKHYSAAIERNPDDPKLYSNRALCYTKLAAFDLGLKDCETCIKLDDKYIKGYIRKGKILQGMQKTSQASAAYQKALELDPHNAEALEGYHQCSMSNRRNPKEAMKNAMSDPELQQILKDPAMRVILEQIQNDRNAIKDHLQNPAIADKIYKLIDAGIIRIL